LGVVPPHCASDVQEPVGGFGWQYPALQALPAAHAASSAQGFTHWPLTQDWPLAHSLA